MYQNIFCNSSIIGKKNRGGKYHIAAWLETSGFVMSFSCCLRFFCNKQYKTVDNSSILLYTVYRRRLLKLV